MPPRRQAPVTEEEKRERNRAYQREHRRRRREESTEAEREEEKDRERTRVRNIRNEITRRIQQGDTTLATRQRESQTERTDRFRAREPEVNTERRREIERMRIQVARSSMTPNELAAELEANRRRKEASRNEFQAFIRNRVAELTPEQRNPPDSNQLLFCERNAMAALHLYHHRTGHEFVEDARDYVDLP